MELYRGTRKDIVEAEIDLKDLDSRIMQKIIHHIYYLYLMLLLLT